MAALRIILRFALKGFRNRFLNSELYFVVFVFSSWIKKKKGNDT